LQQIIRLKWALKINLLSILQKIDRSPLYASLSHFLPPPAALATTPPIVYC